MTKPQRCYNGGFPDTVPPMLLLCLAPDCPNTFEPRKTGGNPQKYCSVQCKTRETARLRFKDTPDDVKLANRRSYWKHRSRLLQERRIRYANNLEFERARSRAYLKLNLDKSRFRSRRYELSKRVSTPNPITRMEWEAIKVAYNFKCAYCGCEPIEITQDHVIPISKGGEDSASNIVPVCQTCNKRKNNLDVAEFIRRLSG